MADSKPWFHGRTEERFWLEITKRPDIGADLNAPQFDEAGSRHWSYWLLTQAREGDLVFHYKAPLNSIVSVSRIGGPAYEDEVVWGSLAGEKTAPYPRPGWRVPLEGRLELEQPVDLRQVREREEAIKRVKSALEADTKGALYFPFEVGEKRPPRAAQAYLVKFPARLVDEFPALAAAVRDLEKGIARAVTDASPPPPAQKGYLRADELAAVSQAEPFLVDPALVERAHRTHARVQNAIADFAQAQGWNPRSPGPQEPNFDLAFEPPGRLAVVEVKSTTPANEEKQLRLGLGQVLRYRQLLSGEGEVLAILAVDKEPRDPKWFDLCKSLGVRLLWSDAIPELATLARPVQS